MQEKSSPEHIQDYFHKHYDNCYAVFEALERAMLSVKWDKTHMFMRTVKYVGHILSRGTRRPHPNRCSAIRDWRWEDITTPKALKGFLGLATEHATSLVEALRGKYLYEKPEPRGPKTKRDTGLQKKRNRIKLTAKESKVQWSEQMKRDFQASKQAPADCVHLHLPTHHGKWRITCDTGNYAIERIGKGVCRVRTRCPPW